jgi:hypothetical protein
MLKNGHEFVQVERPIQGQNAVDNHQVSWLIHAKPRGIDR